MLNNSVVIIAKGPSVLRSTREWIDQFEHKAIINHVPFDGVEDKIGETADYWFKNWQCRWYEPEYLDQIGIKCVVNTSSREFHANGKSFRNLFADHIETDFMHFKGIFKQDYNLEPSSGLMAIEYFIRKGFKNIGFVGIDLYEVGKPRYYVDTQEFGLDPIQNEPSLHDREKSLGYINKVIDRHQEITFHVISDANISDNKNVKFGPAIITGDTL